MTKKKFASNPFLHHDRMIFVVGLIILLCVAFAIRLHHLDFESLHMDEVRQVSYYPHSFTEIIKDAASQQQPPLDYWIGHVVHYFSDTDFAVRLPAAIFGAGSVLLLILLVSQICSWPIAFGTGLIAAILPFNLYFSQDARPYSIAIFFFLAVLWSLQLLLDAKGKGILKSLSLFVLTVCFLFTRTLTPLVVTAALFIVLGIHLGMLLLRKGVVFDSQQRRIAFALVALISGIAVNVPMLKTLVAGGGSYVKDTSLSFGIGTMLSGIKRFDLQAIWQAFAVQTEPLTFPFLILILISPYFVYKAGIHKKSCLWPYAFSLLICSSVLEIIIFRAKSDMPFRAPYAIYILPLAMILATVSFEGIWIFAGRLKQSRAAHFALISIAVILFALSIRSAIAFKSHRRKTDWGGLSKYIETACSARDLLIYDSLSLYGEWEPKFYAAPRYYKGKLSPVRMAQIPLLAGKMGMLSNEPVLILFQWKEYYLTPTSRYHFFPLPAPGMKTVDYKRISSDASLKVTEFTGLSVIRLREPGNNLAKDTYTLITRVLSHLHQDSSAVELHLAAASLAKVLGLQTWQGHIKDAKALAPQDMLQQIESIERRIGSL